MNEKNLELSDTEKKQNKVDLLELLLFQIGGTEALVEIGKIAEKINFEYPCEIIIYPKIRKKRDSELYKELYKLYQKYVNKND